MSKRRLALLVIGLGVVLLFTGGVAATQQYTLAVTQSGGGHGSVTSSPRGISGADLTEKYDQGKQVTLRAKADKDSYFGGWSGGGCSGTGTCKVTMNSDITVTAAFELKTPSISVTPEFLEFASLEVGDKETLTLTIANIGTADLIATISVVGTESNVIITGNNDFHTESGAVVLVGGTSKTMTVKPKKSKSAKVTVNKKSSGEVKGKLKINSNDPEKPVMEVPYAEELAPIPFSIDYVDVNEESNEIEIVGIGFGHNQGDSRVTIEGREVNVKSWTATSIFCDLPIDLAGHVLIASGSLKSNTVPLTRWKGKFEFTGKGRGSQKATVTCDLHIRADIHPYVDKGTQQTFLPIVPFTGAMDSKCHFQLNGEYKFKVSDDECTEKWVGSGDVLINDYSDPGQLFEVLGSVDSQKKKIYLMLASIIGIQQGIRTECTKSGSRTDPLAFNPVLELYDDLRFLEGPVFVIDLSPQFSIIAGRRGPKSDGGDIKTYEVQWNNISAEFPPD